MLPQLVYVGNIPTLNPKPFFTSGQPIPRPCGAAAWPPMPLHTRHCQQPTETSKQSTTSRPQACILPAWQLTQAGGAESFAAGPPWPPKPTVVGPDGKTTLLLGPGALPGVRHQLTSFFYNWCRPRWGKAQRTLAKAWFQHLSTHGEPEPAGCVDRTHAECLDREHAEDVAGAGAAPASLGTAGALIQAKDSASGKFGRSLVLPDLAVQSHRKCATRFQDPGSAALKVAAGMTLASGAVLPWQSVRQHAGSACGYVWHVALDASPACVRACVRVWIDWFWTWNAEYIPGSAGNVGTPFQSS